MDSSFGKSIKALVTDIDGSITDGKRRISIAAIEVLRKVEEKGIPVTICGGSFGFVNFFDYCRRKRLKFQLPRGSRCLDAGGFKGKSREVGRGEFLGKMFSNTFTPLDSTIYAISVLF